MSETRPLNVAMLFSWFRGDPGRISLGRYARWIQAALEDDATFQPIDGTHFNLPQLARRRFPGQSNYQRLPGKWTGQADLIHAIDVWQAVHWRRFSQPFVVTVHDTIPAEVLRVRQGPVHWMGMWQFKRSLAAARHAHAVVTPAESTRSKLIETGFDPARVTAVPVIVPPHMRAAPPEVPHTLDLPPGPTILSIGTALQYKNLPLLLAALGEPEMANVHLVRVGSPLTRSQTRLATKVGVLERVHQVGSVSEDVLLELMWRCTVLAQPSITEGFGMPVAEAMACGLAVVVSNGGALPEVAGDAGMVVPLSTFEPHKVVPDDARSFARALAQVIEDEPLRSRMRTAGLERAGEFRPEAVRPRILDVYRRAIES